VPHHSRCDTTNGRTTNGRTVNGRTVNGRTVNGRTVKAAPSRPHRQGRNVNCSANIC